MTANCPVNQFQFTALLICLHLPFGSCIYNRDKNRILCVKQLIEHVHKDGQNNITLKEYYRNMLLKQVTSPFKKDYFYVYDDRLNHFNKKCYIQDIKGYIHKCKQRVRESVWWSGIGKEVTQFVEHVQHALFTDFNHQIH